MLVAGPTATVAIAGDDPEPPAAVTVTVCGARAFAGVKVRVLVESVAAGLVVEIESDTVTLPVGTDCRATVNDEPAPPCITLEICVGVTTIPSTGVMWRSPAAMLPRIAPPDGVPRTRGTSTGADAFGSFRMGIATVAVAEPTAKVTVVLTDV